MTFTSILIPGSAGIRKNGVKPGDDVLRQVQGGESGSLLHQEGQPGEFQV